MRLFAFLMVIAPFVAASEPPLTWQALDPLPPADGATTQPGVAGPFVGVHNGVLIVAGGANFPEGLPWTPLSDGRKPPKVYHDTIFYLDAPNGTWRQSSARLPQALGYGVSITTDAGIYCIGGEWKEGNDGAEQAFKRFAGSYLLTFDPDRKDVVVKDGIIPDLPQATTAAAGALLGSTIFIAGGDTDDNQASGGDPGDKASRQFLSFDLKNATSAWTELPPWGFTPEEKGPARVLPVAAAQDGQFYLFSGRRPHAGGMEILTDAYAYHPGTETWTQLPDVTADGEARCIMAGTALPFGNQSILVFGGADGTRILEIIRADERHKAARTEAERAPLLADLNRLRDSEHPGFSTEILSFHTGTRAWGKAGQMPGAPVTTTAVRWGNQTVIPSGEIRPGVRDPGVLVGTPVPKRGFGTLNYIALGGYLVLILLNGLWFSRRMKSTDDFFKAGGRIPWWAAGLSIFGTQLSAITFIAIPAAIFASNWTRFVGQITIIAVAPLVVLFFLPFYRRLNLTTAYEYLELRFNRPIRLLGSALFIILQFSRIAVVLFLPAVALSVATGLNINLCILLMGLLCIVYTSLGGMEAVIWTDVIQVIILLGGALGALLIMPFHYEGGFSAMIDAGFAQDKFRVLDFRPSFIEATFFALFLGGFAGNLISYGTDQSVIQRYLTTKDEKAAARAIWTNAALVIPASLIFFSIGTFLFLFYQANPAAYDVALSEKNGLFPLFIVNHLPAGIAGIIIAAVFAASMSSLDSSMNSVSAAVTTDFVRAFAPNTAPAKLLKIARAVVIVVGLFGTLFALWMAQSDIKDLWDTFMKVIGLFGGGLAGIFMLGMFTRTANNVGIMVGLAASLLIQAWLTYWAPFKLHAWMFAFTGLASCFLVGLLASASTHGPKQGPTIRDMRASKKRS